MFLIMNIIEILPTWPLTEIFQFAAFLMKPTNEQYVQELLFLALTLISVHSQLLEESCKIKEW